MQLMKEDRKFIVESTSMEKHIINMFDMSCSCGKESCQHVRALVYKMNLQQDFGDPKRLLKHYKAPAKGPKPKRGYMKRNIPETKTI